MKEKKSIIIAVVILLLVLVGAVGASYAYFATTTKTTGNDKNLNIVTENLGDIKWEGTKVFESGNLLPGECGIQTFTIEKNSASGKGIYEIDLKGILDEAFGSDVEITLYKSTDASNNITIKEGSSTISGDTTKQYYKEDSVVLNGTPEKVYGTKALQNKDQIILEQKDFDNSTLSKTTYYLVYCYKNNGNQDKQQGKSFSGEISVRLILEKSDQCELDDSTAACSIIAQAKTDTTNLAVDDYGNTRYIGANPNNYVRIEGEEYPNDVYFGYDYDGSTSYREYSSLNECKNDRYNYNYLCKVGRTKGTPILWRVIGVMKNVDDGSGNKEDRVKLVRSESIGNYSWDTSESSINKGYGVNEWSQADLMKLLNPGYESETVGGSLYWNNKIGTCYSASSNYTESCNFTNKGMKEKLKNLIGDAVWNIGSIDERTSTIHEITTQKFYEAERSTINGKFCTSSDYCTDTISRTTKWIGKIGLMYSSDYGYATSGGSTTDRATCLNKELYNWEDSNVSDCKNNDWLYNNSSSQWTLSLKAYSFRASLAFEVDRYGRVDSQWASIRSGARPVVYLKSNVKISSGTGSQDDPLVLGS